MKIALVNAVCEFGSTGKICVDLAEEFIEKGHECVVYYGNGKSSKTYSKKICREYFVKLHSLLSRVTGLQGYWSCFSTLKLIIEIKRYKFDVVHIHNIHANFINIPLFLKFLKKNNIPTIITLHDCWFYTGKCTHYTEVSCEKWKNECNHCPKLKKDIPSYFFDFTSKMYNDKRKIFKDFNSLGVIAVSKWIYNEATLSYLKDSNIKIITNWVDLNQFQPQSKLKKSKFSILGVSAKWDESTDKLNQFIELSKLIDDSCEIILIGKMESSVTLPSNIKIIDYISNQKELVHYYSYADVYIHMSYEDSFGKVIVEALACGTPAIVYNSTACPELIENNNGYIVKKGNINEIYEKLELIKKNGKDYYRKNCLNSVKKYDKKILLDKTYQFYEEIINS